MVETWQVVFKIIQKIQNSRIVTWLTDEGETIVTWLTTRSTLGLELLYMNFLKSNFSKQELLNPVDAKVNGGGSMK